MAELKKVTRKDKMVALGRILRAFWRSGIFLSHHPTCGEFEDHVFHIGNIRLCQGCACLYSGFAIAFVAWTLSPFIWGTIWTLNSIESLSISLILFSPTFVQAAGFLKQRILKIIARIMLGIGAFLGFYSILHLPGLFILIVPQALMTYCMIWGGFSVWRNFKMQEDCVNCKFSQELPRCEGLKELYYQFSQIPKLKEIFPMFAQSLQIKQYIERKN